MIESHKDCKNPIATYDLSISNDKKFLASSSNKGIRIYEINPLKVYCRANHATVGKVKTFSLLGSSAFGVYVGKKSNTKPLAEYTANIYCFETDEIGAEITIEKVILKTFITQKKLVLVTESQIFTYDLDIFPMNNVKEATSYTTGRNPLGLCDMMQNQKGVTTIVYPATILGSVQFVTLEHEGKQMSAQSMFQAHKNHLQCLRLSMSGQLLATASSEGTLINLFCTSSFTKLRQLRRGLERTVIYDIDISNNDELLSCIGEKGTCHTFSIIGRKTSVSAWTTDNSVSHSKFSIPDMVGCRIVVDSSKQVSVFLKDGRFYKYLLPTTMGSPCKPVSHVFFNDLALDDEKICCYLTKSEVKGEEKNKGNITLLGDE